MNKKTVIIILVILAILVSVVFFVKHIQGEKQAIDEASYPKIIKVAEDNSSLEVGSEFADFTWSDSKGNEKNLSDYKGKPIILNFWATWCPPCQIEMPDIEKYYNDNKDKTTIIAVNLTETEKSMEKTEEFLEKNGYTFPVVLDDKGLVVQKYLVRSIPTTYFIDGEGIIKKIYTGPVNEDQIKEYVNLP